MISLENNKRTCETCENKDICRYAKEIGDKIKRIMAIADNDLLLVEVRCKRWREGRDEIEIRERKMENEELAERIKNVALSTAHTSAYPPGSANPSCCSVPGTLENSMMEKVRELHFCGPFLCGENDTFSRENP